MAQPIVNIFGQAGANLADGDLVHLTNLTNALAEVNGQDAYSTVGVALGKLVPTEYLAVPTGYNFPVVQPREVGTAATIASHDIQAIAQVYALNKARAPAGENAVAFGMIRARAVAMGWYTGQAETEAVAPIPTALATFAADVAADATLVDRANLWAFLTPMIAEFIFRTTGHHYLTGQAADYDRKYAAVWNACLVSPPSPTMSSGVAYHSALHWVTPSRAREVLLDSIGGDRLPNALAIRAHAAPAGTAVITTSAAVIDSFKATSIYDAVEEFIGHDMKVIEKATKKIKADPVAYHVTQVAYARPPRPATIIFELDEASAAAIRIAWLTQGFINAMLADSPMVYAQALKKHAVNNPVGLKRAERLFRNISKANVESVKQLFSTEAED